MDRELETLLQGLVSYLKVRIIAFPPSFLLKPDCAHLDYLRVKGFPFSSPSKDTLSLSLLVHLVYVIPTVKICKHNMSGISVQGQYAIQVFTIRTLSTMVGGSGEGSLVSCGFPFEKTLKG